MLKLNKSSPLWPYVYRPIPSADGSWPGESSDERTETLVLAGPVTLDVFTALKDLGSDDLVPILIEQAIHAATQLYGWTDEQVRELRSSAWRSAHRYIRDNVSLVDRGAELEILQKILKVDR